MKKHILLIHTGGTISMAFHKNLGTILPNQQNPILHVTNILTNYAQIHEMEAFHIPSPHITPHDMLQLRNVIIQQAKQRQIDGVVITHGTDVIEETAYFLELTTNFSFPIIFTGAIRSYNEIGADGVYNLIGAVRVAIHDEAQNKGVLVVMNDEIHASTDVTKMSTASIDTFQSPQYGPLGIITKKQILFHRIPVKRQYIATQKLEKQVALLKAYAGMEATLVESVMACHYSGLVIEAFGQGNVPPQIAKTLIYFVQQNIPVVIVSRCVKGVAEGMYSYEGGGKLLEEAGVIFAKGLSGQKARLKLLLALNNSIHLQDFFYHHE